MVHPEKEELLIVNKEGVLVVKAELTDSAEEFLKKNRENRIKHILKD